MLVWLEGQSLSVLPARRMSAKEKPHKSVSKTRKVRCRVEAGAEEAREEDEEDREESVEEEATSEVKDDDNKNPEKKCMVE